MTRRRLALLKTGDTAPVVAEQFGDYDVMFRRILDPLEVEVSVVDAFRQAPLPAMDEVDMAMAASSGVI